jgi:MFS family permease
MARQPESAVAPRGGVSAFALIFAIVLLDVLGATLLFPVTAYLVRLYNSDALTVGALSAIYAAAQFVAAPLLGQLSDRYGRRPVLLFCLAGSVFGYLLFGIGGALWVLFVSRVIAGLAGGSLSVAQAYLADLTPPAERAKSYALLGAAFGLGFIIGPALGGGLSMFGLAAPAFAAGGLSLLALIASFFLLPESLPPVQRTHHAFTLRTLNPLAAIGDMVRRSGVGALLLAAVAFNIAFSGMTSTITVFVIDRYAAQPLDIAALFTVGGLISVITQAGFVYRMAPRIGERRLALAGLILLVLGYVGIAVAPTLPALYPISAFSWIGNALLLPTLTALISQAVSAQEQGVVAGVNASLSSLTSAVGPLLAGAVYDAYSPGAPYLVGAAFLLCALLLLVRVNRR